MSVAERKLQEQNERSKQREKVIDKDIRKYIDGVNSEHAIMLWSKSWCPYSDMCKEIFKSHNANFHFIDVDLEPKGRQIDRELLIATGRNTLPMIYMCELYTRDKRKTLKALLTTAEADFKMKQEELARASNQNQTEASTVPAVQN